MISLILILFSLQLSLGCNFGSYKSKSSLQCIECPISCSTCTNILTSCEKCSKGSFLDTKLAECTNCEKGYLECAKGTETVCAPHYQKNSDGKCSQKCNVQNCESCKDIFVTTCEKCESRHTLSDDKSKCVENVRNLQQNIDQNRNSKQNSQQKQNNQSNNSNKPSQPQSEMPNSQKSQTTLPQIQKISAQNVKQMIINNSSPSQNINCSAGYFQNSHKCQKCNQKCLTCVDTFDQCLECADEYIKQGWKCIKNQTIAFKMLLIMQGAADLQIKKHIQQNFTEMYISSFYDFLLKDVLPKGYQNYNSSIISLTSIKITNDANVSLSILIDKIDGVTLKQVTSALGKYLQQNKIKVQAEFNPLVFGSYLVYSNPKINGEEYSYTKYPNLVLQQDQTLKSQNSQSTSTSGYESVQKSGNLVAILIPCIIGGIILLAAIGIGLCYFFHLLCFKGKDQQNNEQNPVPESNAPNPTERNFTEHQKQAEQQRNQQQNRESNVLAFAPSSAIVENKQNAQNGTTVYSYEKTGSSLNPSGMSGISSAMPSQIYNMKNQKSSNFQNKQSEYKESAISEVSQN